MQKGKAGTVTPETGINWLINSNFIECPYCSYEHWEENGYKDSGKYKCVRCGREFLLHIDRTIEYWTVQTEPENEE